MELLRSRLAWKFGRTARTRLRQEMIVDTRQAYVERSARRTGEKKLDQPGHPMDRHALRAIVNGAVHGDSALVSADQLMAAGRFAKISAGR
jgi:hypothetical protein